MVCACEIHPIEDYLTHHIKSQRYDDEVLNILESLENSKADCLGKLLHCAAQAGNATVSQFLVESGVAVDYLERGGITPLMTAIQLSHKNTVRALLKVKARIDIANDKGESALYLALHCKADFKVVEAVLLRLKAEAPTTEILVGRLMAAQCSFAYAALLRDADALKDLLRRGYDVNSRNCENRTALHYSTLVNNIGMVKLLIDYGADVNTLDNCNVGPLYYAANILNPNMVKLLLDHNADPYPSKCNRFDELPLCVALIVGGSDDDDKISQCVEILLQRGSYHEKVDLVAFYSAVRSFHGKKFERSRMNCLTAHLVMLEMLGTLRCEELQNLIKKFSELKDYYYNCLEILKTSVVGTISLLDLLVFTEDTMRLHVRRSKTFVLQVEQFCSKPELQTRYTYYVNILMKHTAEAVSVVELENKAILIICSMFDCNYNKFVIFARQVVGFLSKCDLVQLCNVIVD